MGVLYHIRDWSETYETADTRKTKSVTRVPVPNKHDGLGFRRMAAQPDAVALFCAWNLLVQVASRGKGEHERGYLARDEQPLTAEDLAVMTGFEQSIFERAFEFFSDPKQGWLEKIVTHDGAPLARPGADGRAGEAAGAHPEESGARPDPSGECPGVSESHPDVSGWHPDTLDHPENGAAATRKDEESLNAKNRLLASRTTRTTPDGLSSGNGRGAIRSSLSQETFEPLLARIREVTGEPDTRMVRSLYAFYLDRLGMVLMERALASTKAKKIEPGGERLRNAGAYMNRTCQKLAREAGIDLQDDGKKSAA